MPVRFVIVCLALLVAACGDDDAGESKDVVTATETAVATDTSVADVPADTAITPDTEPADTEPADTEPADTEPADTGPEDTGPADTGPADTGPADTGPEDTGPEDVTEGPEHLEVFFASVMSFGTDLQASQIDGGLATKIVGTGDQGSLTVQFSGVTTGTYTCGPTITNVMWTRTSGVTEHTDAATGGSCTIVVTKYQAGGRIEGTFSGVMAAPPPDMGIPFNEGTFSVFIQ